MGGSCGKNSMPKDEVAKGNAQKEALKKIKAIKKSHPDNLAIKHFDLDYCEFPATHPHPHPPHPTHHHHAYIHT